VADSGVAYSFSAGIEYTPCLPYVMTSSHQRCEGQPARPILGVASLRAVALLTAGHLAAATGAAADAARSHAADGVWTVGKRRTSRNLLRQRAGQSPGLLVPQPNDTIPEEYWADVNRAIYNQGLHTPPPASLNDPSPTPTPEPWKKIIKASADVNVMDTPDAQNHLLNWEYATPQPFSSSGSPLEAVERKMGVVPYDMELGAHIMYGLSAKSSESLPPTQASVDEAFIAQCPMIMFGDALYITAPRCGSDLGAWTDPSRNRAILRWRDNGKGGLYMGLDSAVTGEGSVKFAEYVEKFTLNKYHFELRNCMNAMRYTVEEQVIKVNHMAPHASSTMLEHDISKSHEAIFYKYVINHPNGTSVAQTNLYRMDQSEVNFTFSAETGDGAVFAVARRQGFWQRDQWRLCTQTRRGWALDFMVSQSSFETVATVQDLRVAAAATITLMAFRDEDVGTDGFQHTGQGHMYWVLARSVFLAVLAIAGLCLCWIVVTHRNLDRRARWLCFRLETFLLPKRPVKERQPVLHPAY